MKRMMETPKKAKAMDIQTRIEKGDMKENKLGGFTDGFTYKIVMPKFMKGIVKSTAS
jgi:hypothetical protein